MEQAELKQEPSLLMLLSVGKVLAADGPSDANPDGDTDAISVGNAEGISESLLEGAIDSVCVVVGTEDGTSGSLLDADCEGDKVGWSEDMVVGGTVSPATTSVSV